MSIMKPNLEYHIETLRQLQAKAPELHEKFNSISNTLAYTAPEILNQRAWINIYRMCSTYFTNRDNLHHAACFSIYNKRYIKFKQLQ